MVTRRSLLIAALMSAPLMAQAKRTKGSYDWLPPVPRRCTLIKAYEDHSAYARCKHGKYATFDPDTGKWTKHLRHS